VDVLRSSGHEVVALTRGDLDVRDAAACLLALKGSDVVVNTAAWTNVDGAEADEREAFAVNAVGAANVARACALHGARMVHLSTDYVFPGDGTTPYPVDAPIAPINAYGRTKAAGEWAVRAECPGALVVRTAWLYGAHGDNFVRSILRLSDERDTLDVVADQRGQPTWTRDVAAFIRDIARADEAAGVHHATSSGETTWYGLARAAFRLADLDPGRIRATTADRFPRPAPRPAYSVLASRDRLPHWEESLGRAFPALLAAAGRQQ